MNQRNEISGFILGATNQEKLLQLTLAIAKAIGTQIQPEELLKARILRKQVPPGPVDESAATAQATRVSFAVPCKDHSTAARVLAAKRSHGPLKLSQLEANTCADIDIARNQPGDPTIHINELLPSYVFNLLTEAKTRLKGAGFKYIWTRNLTVYAKFTDDSPVQIVNSSADLPGIIQLYANQELARAQ